MRRKLYLVVSILILSIITIFTWIQRDGSLKNNETRFRLNNPEDIIEIHITSASDTSILLKSDAIWRIGDEKANSAKVQQILFFASLLEAIAPVPVTLRDSLSKKSETGLVIVFKNRWTICQSYTLFRMDDQLYARLKYSKNAFRIAIKGHPTIDLMEFISPDEAHWKNNMIINYPPGSVGSIELRFPDRPLKGFQILRSDSDKMMLYTSESGEIIENVNQELVKEYLYYFSNIEKIPITESEKWDDCGIWESSPFFLLSVSSKDGEVLELTGYRKKEKETSNPDKNYFYGIVSGNDTILLKYSDFDAILVTLDYFRKN